MVAAISDKTLKKAVEDVEYNVVGINREQFKIPRFFDNTLTTEKNMV
jgi:hypothetical protein